MADSDLQQTLSSLAVTLAPFAQTVAQNPRDTLVPAPSTLPSGKRAVETLKRLHRDSAAVEILGPLGQGGMGVVSVGRQVVLDRAVAIKTLRDEHRTEDNIERLLAEAWLVGSLEHPNVVPVYDLGLDRAGAPQLVMKRLEGETWATLLADDDAAKKLALDRDLLDFHLGVFTQVCNAVHFAHSRGVVHRDLKPANVMVGSYAEVSVLDWGVAVAPGPVTAVAGTLPYMAPEMLGGEVSAQTDVYLLGAVLHEVVTGQPPHLGANMQALLTSILGPTPTVPASVPGELASLITACLQREAAQRPASALEVRRAVERFLEHRGSMTIATQAVERLVELEAALAASARDATRVATLFSECRFGLQQALRAWPENPTASAALRRALTAMIHFEVSQKGVRAAASLLAELREPDAALVAVVNAARVAEADEAQRVERLKALEAAHDPRAGLALRRWGGVLFGLIFAAAPLPGPWFARTSPQLETLGSVPFCLVSLVVLVWGAHRFPLRTQVNLQLTRAFAFSLGAQPTLAAALYLVNFPGQAMVTVTLTYWCIAMGMMAAALEWRLAPMVVGYVVAAVASWRWPDSRYQLMAAANLVSAVNAGFIWSRGSTERELARRER